MFADLVQWLEGIELYSGDTWDYVSSADGIVAGHSGNPFRLPGFPVMIALCKILFGGHWEAAVVGGNILVMGVSSIFLYRLMRDLSWPRWIQLVVMLAYNTGAYAFYSRFILTNCVYSSLAIVTVSILCRICLVKASRVDTIACFASLFVMGFWRETTLYFAITLLPVLFVLCQCNKKKAISICASFAITTAIPIGTMLLLNQYRIGVAVLSTGQGHALTLPLSRLSQVNPDFIKETCLKEVFPNGGKLSWWDDY